MDTLTATITKTNTGRWMLHLSGFGQPFTKESLFDSRWDAQIWAESYAKSCGITRVYAVVNYGDAK